MPANQGELGAKTETCLASTATAIAAASAVLLVKLPDLMMIHSEVFFHLFSCLYLRC